MLATLNENLNQRTSLPMPSRQYTLTTGINNELINLGCVTVMVISQSQNSKSLETCGRSKNLGCGTIDAEWRGMSGLPEAV